MTCQTSLLGVLIPLALLAGCTAAERAPRDIVAPADRERPPYDFTADEEAFLDEVQAATFQYFWQEVGDPSQMVKDRKLAPVSSIAAVGFQLASLPIGVERGWVSHETAERRAATILQTLLERDDNKKFGVYLHFPDLNDGGLSHEGYEIVASTVDHALFMAGAIVAAEYFGRDVALLTDRLIEETNWQAYAVGPDGFISMGWRADDPNDIHGDGRFLDWHWYHASDEERLVYFLAAGAPRDDHAVDPALYYRLKRVVKRHADLPPFVVSWPGTLFTYFFSHCYIDYAALGPDDPAAFGVADAVRVDWFENSRRAVLTQRHRCLAAADRYRTLGDERWGLSACDGRDGYIVPDVRPNISGQDNWHAGTVAPYAAGSAIMFAPREALAALRAFRTLEDEHGRPLVWRDPAEGGYGFADCFNLDQGYVSADYIGIDQGPLLLAIENARTGLIWRLFMRHEAVQRSLDRLRLGPR